MKALSIIFLFSFVHLQMGCVSTTESGQVGLERKQLLLVSSGEVEAQSGRAYEQVKTEAAKKGQLDKNAAQVSRVQKIANKIIPHVGTFRQDALDWKWEVHVESNDELNAYCMPGGKMMFYTGIIDRLQLTDNEIAAIMGHEMAHALREHGREQMSEQIVKIGLIQLGVESGLIKENYAGALIALSEMMIGLPHSRGQESEADLVGVELMARAGFNPQEAVSLWKKMSSGGGGKPPEFLSTHPSDESRIKNIQSILPRVMPIYQSSQKNYGGVLKAI